jgi:hypothetical protein
MYVDIYKFLYSHVFISTSLRSEMVRIYADTICEWCVIDILCYVHIYMHVYLQAFELVYMYIALWVMNFLLMIGANTC